MNILFQQIICKFSLKGSNKRQNVADWEAIDILVGFSNIFIEVKFFAEKCLQK